MPGQVPVERPQTARDLAERYETALGQQLIEEPIDEPAAPPPADRRRRPSPRVEGDRRRTRSCTHLEALMPEPIAVVKLRGFVDDIGGEVVESVPGLIRVRLGETPRDCPRQAARACSRWLGLAEKPATVSLARPTEMELHMEKKGSTVRRTCST